MCHVAFCSDARDSNAQQVCIMLFMRAWQNMLAGFAIRAHPISTQTIRSWHFYLYPAKERSEPIRISSSRTSSSSFSPSSLWLRLSQSLANPTHKFTRHRHTYAHINWCNLVSKQMPAQTTKSARQQQRRFKSCWLWNVGTIAHVRHHENESWSVSVCLVFGNARETRRYDGLWCIEQITQDYTVVCTQYTGMLYSIELCIDCIIYKIEYTIAFRLVVIMIAYKYNSHTNWMLHSILFGKCISDCMLENNDIAGRIMVLREWRMIESAQGQNWARIFATENNTHANPSIL